MGAFELRFDGFISLVTLLFSCNNSAVTVLCLAYKYILRPNYCLSAHVIHSSSDHLPTAYADLACYADSN